MNRILEVIYNSESVIDKARRMILEGAANCLNVDDMEANWQLKLGSGGTDRPPHWETRHGRIIEVVLKR